MLEHPAMTFASAKRELAKLELKRDALDRWAEWLREIIA
jgi:hypothetical protein